MFHCTVYSYRFVDMSAFSFDSTLTQSPDLRIECPTWMYSHITTAQKVLVDGILSCRGGTCRTTSSIPMGPRGKKTSSRYILRTGKAAAEECQNGHDRDLLHHGAGRKQK